MKLFSWSGGFGFITKFAIHEPFDVGRSVKKAIEYVISPSLSDGVEKEKEDVSRKQLSRLY